MNVTEIIPQKNGIFPDTAVSETHDKHSDMLVRLEKAVEQANGQTAYLRSLLAGE